MSADAPRPAVPIEPSAATGRQRRFGWRQIAVAVAALAFLGAGVGTAFGLSRDADKPNASPSGGGSSPSVSVQASPSESATASVTPSTGPTDCGSSCPSEPTDGARTVAVPNVVGTDEAIVINMPTSTYRYDEPDAWDLPWDSQAAQDLIPYRF